MADKFEHTSATTREFTFEFLQQITDDFSDEHVIGRGGYGVVYKGVLENGEEIALKKLHHLPGLDDTQFTNEFNNLMRAQHPNITRLVGYCYYTGHERILYRGEYVFALVEERVLCFEYLQGGSLDKHISDESCGLDWHTRFKIIKGVCEGLNYLHNGYEHHIYHLDLKPGNILLDKNMVPKIGDFGLSRLFPSEQTYITVKNIGTPGYMPPEYIERREITSKYDVFSLGAIILRILAGEEGHSKCARMSSQDFLEHVHENWGKRLEATMSLCTSEQVKTCIKIALRCVEVKREKRPTIAEIVHELNNVDTAESSLTGQVDQAMPDETKLMDGHPSQLTLDLTLVAMGSLLGRLGNVMKKEYKLEEGVQKKVKSLSTELQIMQAALSKVAEVPVDQLDKQVGLWAADVRELSCDMEAAVDSLMVGVDGCEPNANHDSSMKLMAKMANMFKKFTGVDNCEPNANQDSFMKLMAKMENMIKNGKACREISTAVKEIHEQLQGITNQHQSYNFPNLPATTTTRITIDPVMEALYGDKKNIIGLEKARDEIINKIKEGDGVSKEQLRILSIVGFGGLGKTTLAKEVFDALPTKFDYKAFVSVSRNPDMKKVLDNLLFKLDYKRHASLNLNAANIDEEKLIILIRELLTKKRYFIIIDDLWDEEAWRKIRYALMDNECGSIIITTTRHVNVSDICCSSKDDMIHRMKPLAVDDSKKLFYGRIFPGEVCPSSFEKVSKDILKKCAGVPLAIISLASFLASKQRINRIDQWYGLLEDIGRGLKKGDNHVEEMKRILSLSYYDLPSHLKVCFLYLSIFPEDHQINRARLIRRWISEGFIQAEDETSLLVIGENYFNELLNRNMIQPILVDERVEACCVHDIMLDLILELSSKVNFVTILDVIKEDAPFETNFRRLSLQKSMSDVTATQMAATSMRQVRSFTAFSPAISWIPPLSIFEVLCVLDLEGCDFGKRPGIDLRPVGNMVQLRYLGLRGTKVGNLPMEIEKLHFLQTLDLQRTNSKELPSSVVQLRHLMCLVLDLGMSLPKGFSNLACLEQMVGHGVGLFSADSAEELGHLIRLRELAFQWEKRRHAGSSFLSLGDMRSDKPLSEIIYPREINVRNKALMESLGNDLRTDKALVKSIGKLYNLESLEISAATDWAANLMQDWVPPPNLCRFKFNEYFESMPTWICSSSLPQLSYLDLTLEKARSEDIQILGMLPALRYVTLLTNLKEGRSRMENLVLSAGAFPCARVCLLHKVVLVQPIFQPGAMPMVQRIRFGLRVDDILNSDFDLSIRNLPSLQKLRIDLLSNKFKPEADYCEAVDALRHLADDHPTSPILRVDKY